MKIYEIEDVGIMPWIVDYMQKVTIKNLTGKDIKNIILSHNGEGRHETKIKKLKVNEEKIEYLYTLRVKKECDLIFSCDYNNTTKKEIIYNKLSSSNRPNITIELKEEDSDLIINTIIKSNLEIVN